MKDLLNDITYDRGGRQDQQGVDRRHDGREHRHEKDSRKDGGEQRRRHFR